MSFVFLAIHMVQGFENLRKLFQCQKHTASKVQSKRGKTSNVTEFEGKAELSDDSDQEAEEGPWTTKKKKGDKCEWQISNIDKYIKYLHARKGL